MYDDLKVANPLSIQECAELFKKFLPNGAKWNIEFPQNAQISPKSIESEEAFGSPTIIGGNTSELYWGVTSYDYGLNEGGWATVDLPIYNTGINYVPIYFVITGRDPLNFVAEYINGVQSVPPHSSAKFRIGFNPVPNSIDYSFYGIVEARIGSPTGEVIVPRLTLTGVTNAPQ